jgi:hypothetical protein
VVVGATGAGFDLDRLINIRIVAEEDKLPKDKLTAQIT